MQFSRCSTWPSVTGRSRRSCKAGRDLTVCSDETDDGDCGGGGSSITLLVVLSAAARVVVSSSTESSLVEWSNTDVAVGTGPAAGFFRRVPPFERVPLTDPFHLIPPSGLVPPAVASELIRNNMDGRCRMVGNRRSDVVLDQVSTPPLVFILALGAEPASLLSSKLVNNDRRDG